MVGSGKWPERRFRVKIGGELTQNTVTTDICS